MTREDFHDKGYKELLSKKRNFINFLRHFVKYAWVGLIDEDSLELCDKEFVSRFFDKMMSDLIYSVKIEGRYVYFFVLMELQSTPDNTMPFRIFEYTSAILSRAFYDTPKEVRERKGFRLPVVVPVVFYNGANDWAVTGRFRDYLQDDGLFQDVGVIDFEYTLVDINMLDRGYLLQNHDAICAALAVDTVRGDGAEALAETIRSVVRYKDEFKPEDFSDFMFWFKNTVSHRTESEQEADTMIDMLMKGDEKEMSTGLNLLFDNFENKTKAKVAINLLKLGLAKDKVAEATEMPVEWVDEILVEDALVS